MFNEVGVVCGIDNVGKKRVCQVDGCAGVGVDSGGGAATWLGEVHLCCLRTVLSRCSFEVDVWW